MSQVFVSYAREDHETALRIVKTIRQAGLGVWATDSISPGDHFSEQVGRELDKAQCVVVIWSEAAARSDFLQLEIHRAIQAWSSDRLVLAALDDMPLPVGLKDLEPIPFRKGYDSGTKELIERARAILQRPAIAAAPPAWTKARSFGLISALVMGFAGLVFGALILTTFDKSSSEPSPLALTNAPLWLILIVLSGLAIVAGMFWLWNRWSTPQAGHPPPSAANGPQVFISYSHLDERTVEQLVQKIEQAGCVVWIDRKSSKGLQRFAGPIVRAIRASRLVALMCSQNAFASDHVIREVYLAGDWKKPFLIFHLDPTEFPDDIIYFVTGFPRFPATIDSQQLRSEIIRMTGA